VGAGLTFKGLCAVLAVFCWAPAVAQTPVAASPASVPTLDDFFQKPAMSAVRLSPDGQNLAYVLSGDTTMVVVTGLTDLKSQPVLEIPGKGVTVDWLEWKDNNRLVVGATVLDVNRRGDGPAGDIISFRYGQFLFAVDRDGKNEVRLLKENFWNQARGRLASLVDRLRDDPDHILAQAPDTAGLAAVWKVNIHTGEGVVVEKGNEAVTGWRTDSTGAVVARIRISGLLGRTVLIEGRAPGETGWATIATLRQKDFRALDDFEILGAAEKPSQFYVAVSPTGNSQEDTRSVHIYDVATRTLSAPVWPALKYDVSAIVYHGDSTRLAGVCYVADSYTCDFKDPVVDANYRKLLKYFHDQRSITPISISHDSDWWLLSVSGPDEPAGYYIYHRAEAKIEPLAERFPQLPAEALAVMDRYTYTARDGSTVPAYLTRPRGAPRGPLPLIVMPHGGPVVRDAFQYDVWSQFFATRGYLVFQPNYRRSGGYGRAYAEAGYGQWGGLIADDITDGVRKLIDTGQADPNRVCVFGASFGGYAALYAGATHPELYKCVVSWAGVADLSVLMRDKLKDDGKDSAAYQYWLKALGDPDKNAAALKSASPVTYAATYQRPVLLIHGEADGNVDVEQSRIMERALKKAGREVNLITFKNEDHTGWEPEDEKAALADVLSFIEAHIAPATLSPETPAADPPPLPTK
jgi:dipeptidyl aminopeptidase/acylaminoacyl peptidase